MLSSQISSISPELVRRCSRILFHLGIDNDYHIMAVHPTSVFKPCKLGDSHFYMQGIFYIMPYTTTQIVCRLARF